jgi:hypothetical protein
MTSCCNHIQQLPMEIGYLKRLTILDISKNKLTHLPDSIGQLLNLTTLNISQNQLNTLPKSIGQLERLNGLDAHHNILVELPLELGNLSHLVTLNVSQNPLIAIPVELQRLRSLRTLSTESCPFLIHAIIPFATSVITLKELSARVLIKQSTRVNSYSLSEYLESAQKCSFCGGPFFDQFFKRYKIHHLNQFHIAYEYRLCRPHWETNRERIYALFHPKKIVQPMAKSQSLTQLFQRLRLG